jgi:succinoglycan biosynthesis transport protein ExoP
MPNELDNPVFRSWEDYWAMALRRRWWILLPLFVAWTAVWGVSWLLPSTYQSEALILVEEQKVPERYVTPNVTTNLQERLESLTEQILSRTRLQAAIDRFHLYSRPDEGLVKSGDPVEQMRNDIKIELVETPGRPGEFTAFKMRYSAQIARACTAR